MKRGDGPVPEDAQAEVAALIDTLHRTQYRLQELTGSDVEVFGNADGRTLLSRRTDDQLPGREIVRQAAVLNSLPAQVALLDVEGQILTVNQSWRQFGRENGLQDEHDTVGANYLSACSGGQETDGNAIAEGIRSVLTGQVTHFSIEYPCHSSQEERWFLMTASPLSGDSQDGVVVMHSNITERRRAEIALRELTEETARRERVFSTLLSSISDFACILDREGRFLFANQPMLNLLGIDLESALGRTFFDLGSRPETAGRLQSQVQRVLHTLTSMTDEVAYTGPDGVPGHYEYIFSPVIAADGTAEFVVGSSRDITQRKKAEDELRDSDQKFHLLAENIVDAFWIRSADMREVHYLSPAFERIWGRPRETLLSNPHLWTEFILAEDREKVAASFATLTRDNPSLDLEYRIVRPDGEIRWIRARGFQVRDAEGTLVRTTGIVTDVTEQQRAAAELRASEREFRTLAEAMPQIVWIARADGYRTYFNQQWTDYTGLPLEDSLGDTWKRAFFPEDRQRAEDAWGIASNAGGTYTIEARLLRADGEYRWWLLRGVPLKEESGKILKWFGTCTDIHDMKIAELAISRSNRELEMIAEALRRSEEEQRQLAEELERERYRLVEAQRVAKVGSWETDLTTMRVLWSAETHRIHETDPRTFHVTHENFLGFVHPDDRRRVDEAFVESRKQPGERSIEHRLLLPNGRCKSVEERWQVTFDERGTPVRAIGTSQDITVRKQAENALQQSQKRLRDVFDGLGPSMFAALLTPEGIVVEINRSPLEAGGVEAADVIGRMFAETYWWSHSPAVQQQLREAIARAALGEPSRYDVRILGAGENFIDIDFSLQPLRDDTGTVIFLIPSASVITERKLAEEALRQSQKMEAVGKLAAGVAHEFNNILQALMSMASMTRLRGTSPEIVKIGSDMEGQIRRGASITQQLLLSSRNQEPVKTVVDLREEVRTASELLRRLIPESIRLVVESTSDRVSIDGDAGQIQQVLFNLAINARDAMPEGGLLTIRLGARAGEVVLEVEDDGAGFDETIRERIFEPFFTTKEVGKGTGLGLAVVYRIVEQHGGRIEAFSHPGQGSRFRVNFPAAALARDADVRRASEEQSNVVSGRVLLVEDEEGVREGVALILEMMGYEVIAVGRGEDALALVLDPPPDLLLSDVTLPGIGGPAMAELLLERWPSLKVTLMTGYADEATRSRARQHGWNILQKPFEMSDLAKGLTGP